MKGEKNKGKFVAYNTISRQAIQKRKRKRKKAVDMPKAEISTYGLNIMKQSSSIIKNTFASILFGVVSNAIKSAPELARICTLFLWKPFSICKVIALP